MIPQNEQGTIVLFSKLAEELGYTFKEIGTRCPDAILEKDDKPVRVEFEFRSKSFLAHKHNPDDVDLVICWEDNWPSCPVPVLSLETYVTLAHRTEEASPSWWQRLLNLRRDICIGLSNMRRFIKASRIENQICKFCGGGFQSRARYTTKWKKLDGSIVVDGAVFRTCRTCGYIESENVEYYEGMELD